MPARKQTAIKSRKARRPGDAVSRSQPNPFPVAPSGPELKMMYNGVNDQQIYHNVPLAMFNAVSLLDAIAVGTASYQRVGNLITLREIALRMLVNNKADRPNVTYRLTVVAVPGVTVSTDTWPELFTGSSGSATQPINGHPIPGVAKVLYDRYFGGGTYSVTPITSGGTAKERSFHHNCRIKLNHPVRYTGDGVAGTRLCCYINAYDAYGSLTTDNIASIANAGYALYFTDD